MLNNTYIINQIDIILRFERNNIGIIKCSIIPILLTK
jgi:hypothetical protein